MSHASLSDSSGDPQQLIRRAVDHLNHQLPGQAPLLQFVHHNTLHGYQHLPFGEALGRFGQLTGIRTYLPDESFRAYLKSGRILVDDLEAAYRESADINADEIIWASDAQTIRRGDLYTIALVYGLDGIRSSELAWQIEEMGVLENFQTDVPPEPRHRFLNALKQEGGESPPQYRAIMELWTACLGIFQLDYHPLDPEALTDLVSYPVERLLHPDEYGLPDYDSRPLAHERMLVEADYLLESLFPQEGERPSLRELLLILTGQDILESVRPELIRLTAAHLDEGVASWLNPDRTLGLYATWCRVISDHQAGVFSDARLGLCEQAIDTVYNALQGLELPPDRWESYLQQLVLELPGWAGMLNWRYHQPHYPANRQAPVDLMDFIAIRLVLDHLAFTRLCHEIWQISPTLRDLKSYFSRHRAELFVRHALYRGQLPEYLAVMAQQLVIDRQPGRKWNKDWQSLADMIYTWQSSPVAEHTERRSPHRDSWRLFRLAQHLGFTVTDIEAMPPTTAHRLLAVLDELTPDRRGQLWLSAFERRYREEFFNAVARNQGHGLWPARNNRPAAQVIFCMDDREESIRRHLEEISPDIETLGAAGFFGIAMNWQGLDDETFSPLCPVVVTPQHEVVETPKPDEAAHSRIHTRFRNGLRRFSMLFNHETRRNPLTTGLVIDLAAPGIVLNLVGKVLFPGYRADSLHKLTQGIVPAIETTISLNADSNTPPTPGTPRSGFTDSEQADRVQAMLQNMGLTHGFGSLVAVIGHGSLSENNPHRAAYACGACGGRHGGPNARVYAAMANRPEVRTLLAERGLAIPDDTWFVAAEHNTSTDALLWYDLTTLPSRFRPYFNLLNNSLEQAAKRSAHERCRRFASAPPNPGLPEALRHVVSRAFDFSQSRPELGHATNASAIIGRRSISQGLFLDRRSFLISYDASQDTDGTRLEGILLAAGPVGAGINLEYYFSSVDPERFGCGSKMTHNLIGWFGIMDGTQSDLRTGLPRQMTEIHEPMRLLILVEHRQDILAAILERQPALQELIGNAWVQLAAIDPDSGEIARFIPGVGFQTWQDGQNPLPQMACSADWYAGHNEPLWPAQIMAVTE